MSAPETRRLVRPSDDATEVESQSLAAKKPGHQNRTCSHVDSWTGPAVEAGALVNRRRRDEWHSLWKIIF